MEPLHGSPTRLFWISETPPTPTFPSTSKPKPSMPSSGNESHRLKPLWDGAPQVPGWALKRFLLIFSDRILDSSVDRAIPSFAAAPDGPKTRPWHSRRAASMISFSCAATFSERSSWLCGLPFDGCWDSQLSSTEKFSVSHTMTDRSITFCNSRMFPGQGYDSSNRRVFLSTVVILLPAFRA